MKRYRQAAKRCGVKPPDPDKIEAAFPEAYEQATQQYPLFGGKDMHSKDWWRHCVLDSLKRAGCEMTDEDKEVDMHHPLLCDAYLQGPLKSM